MANVGTSQEYVGLEIVPATTFGTNPGSGWLRVPLLSQTIDPVQDLGPADDEIGLGARGTLGELDFARRFERGTVRMKAYYNLPVQQMMIASAMGGCEVFSSGKLASNSTVTVGGGDYSGTHHMMPQSYFQTATGSSGARPPGFAGRIWKSGENLDGHIATLDGMYINAMRFEQPQGDYPVFEFDYDTLKATPGVASGSISTVPSGLQPVIWDDLSANPTQADGGLIFIGGVTVPLYSMSWSLSRGSSFQSALATNPTQLSQPRHTDAWQLTGEFVVPLESGVVPSARPLWPPFVANNPDHVGIALIRYSGPQIALASVGGFPVGNGYAFNFSGLKYGTIEGGLQRGTPTLKIPFSCQSASSSVNIDAKTYRPLFVFSSQHYATGATGDGGATFLPAASGGNDIPLGEIRLT